LEELDELIDKRVAVGETEEDAVLSVVEDFER
jgi:hypothetical protein